MLAYTYDCRVEQAGARPYVLVEATGVLPIGELGNMNKKIAEVLDSLPEGTQIRVLIDITAFDNLSASRNFLSAVRGTALLSAKVSEVWMASRSEFMKTLSSLVFRIGHKPVHHFETKARALADLA